MKIQLKLTIASAILAITLTGCAVDASNNVTKQSNLSLNQIEKAFEDNGLKVTEHLAPKEPDIRKAYNGVFPSAQLNTQGYGVMVNLYENEADARKAVDEYMTPFKGVTFNGPWTMSESAKNAMFLLSIQASKEATVIEKLK